MQSILIIEDDKRVADLLKAGLEESGYHTMVAYDGAMGLRLFASNSLNLVLSDVILPKLDGFELCKEIRKTNASVPILMLTALGSTNDKLDGFDAGADDYMVKPFETKELVARVKAQLRRYTRYNTHPDAAGENVVCVRGLVLNADSHVCTLDEKPLTLTPTEFSILWLLCETPGKVISAEALFERVWGEKYLSNSSNTVMVHIRHLREKLGESPERPRYIKTVWGVGYKIEA